MSGDFSSYVKHCIALTDAQLDIILPAAEGPAERLFGAMRYAVFNGGKRIRPVLCFAAAEALADATGNAAKVAAAVEMIHAYSLVHDDLPAMDDDDLRRGKPTCHIAFDEASAILAGDGLQALAFQQLTDTDGLSPQIQVQLVALLARLGGCSGMVAGQAIDLAATGQQISLQQRKNMHAHKTGALIEASVLMGALSTGVAVDEDLGALSNYARAIGLAFQIQDDILDVESSTEQLGKQQGADLARGKATYTSILGLEAARQALAEQHRAALDALQPFAAKGERLVQIADFIVQRQH